MSGIKDPQVQSHVYKYSTGETASSHINIIIKDLQVLMYLYDEDQGTSGPDLHTVKTHHTTQLIQKINYWYGR